MNYYSQLEPFLVGLIVALSALALLRSKLPGALTRITAALRRAGVPESICERLAPTAAGSCNTGCKACSGCGPTKESTFIVVHPTPRHARPEK